MQLDALQSECNALKVENRRLREEHPAEAKELELEQELAETRGENVRLAQTITRFEGELEAERQGTGDEESSQAVQSLCRETEELREKLRDAEARLDEDRAMVAEWQDRAERAARRSEDLEERLQRTAMEAELRELRKVAEVSRKWKEREERLVRRIEELEKEQPDPPPLTGSPVSAREVRNVHFASTENELSDSVQAAARSTVDSTQANPVPLSAAVASTQASPVALSASVASPVALSHSHTQHHHGDDYSSVMRVEAPPFHPTVDSPTDLGHQKGDAPTTTHLDSLSAVLLAQQLPPLPNFTGNCVDGEGESIDDWLERLELVAATCHWEEQAKLVNVAARLRGSASRFYRSCTPRAMSV